MSRRQFDPNYVALSTDIGSPLLFARCTLSGCGWNGYFSTYRYGVIAQEISEHPCAGETPRCETCEHLRDAHVADGCRFEVAGMVCPCMVPR